MPQEMTTALWVLAASIVWTILILLSLLFVRLRHLRAGGSVRDFGRPDDASLLWRLFRAHYNAIENLPLLIGIVVVLTVREIDSAFVGGLAIVYLIARLTHTIVHVAGWNPRIRLAMLITQMSCLIGMLSVGVS